MTYGGWPPARGEDVRPQAKQYEYMGEDDPVEEPAPSPRPDQQLTPLEMERLLMKQLGGLPKQGERQTVSWERGPDGIGESKEVAEADLKEHQRRVWAREDERGAELRAKAAREREEQEGTRG
ncbi:MAG: hypothetical protein ACRC20_13970 [Segniliparus sp.]|uniref:hypothetical protein n=1 Tax=Segniliparus sp. TaxID=2804064 RepID=UPI003F3087D6